jgi:outer membrane protein assembly factor BamA
MKKLFLLQIITAFIFSSEVNSIKIIGNKYTKPIVILREINHEIPGEFHPENAELDRNRIYNLGLFSTVTIDQVGDEYVITVVETMRFMPFPMFMYEEAGWSYGGGVVFNNFRGMHQKILIGGTLGNSKMYFLNYEDPWFAGDHIGLRLGIQDVTQMHSLFDFNLNVKEFSIGSGFHQNLIHKYQGDIGVALIHLSETDTTINEPINLEMYEKDYSHIFAKFIYEYDTRDIYMDPTKGTYLYMTSNSYFGFDNSNSYHQITSELIKYYQISNRHRQPIFSSSTKLLLQTSKLPIYAHVSLGGSDYVRGYSRIPSNNSDDIKDLIDVESIIYQSFQIQHTVLPKKDFGGMELGIDLAYFVDVGFGFSTEEPKLMQPLIGYGFGFRFFASGMGVISLDFGFSPVQDEWHLHM